MNYFREELENKNCSVNLIENIKKTHFFGTEIVGNLATVSYNPYDLLKLKVGDIIEETTIVNTARYFAEHEYQHWTPRFQVFNSTEFNEYNPSEKQLLLMDSHGDTYFTYNDNNLRYLFIEFLIDSSLNGDFKKTDNLFIQYNLNRLEEVIITLNVENYKSDVEDEMMINGFTKDLKSKKFLNKILERALRLYGLNQSFLVKNLFKEKKIKPLLEIINNVHRSLLDLSNSSLEIGFIKEIFIDIKKYLEDQDYIQVFFL